MVAGSIEMESNGIGLLLLSCPDGSRAKDWKLRLSDGANLSFSLDSRIMAFQAFCFQELAAA